MSKIDICEKEFGKNVPFGFYLETCRLENKKTKKHPLHAFFLEKFRDFGNANKNANFFIFRIFLLSTKRIYFATTLILIIKC